MSGPDDEEVIPLKRGAGRSPRRPASEVRPAPVIPKRPVEPARDTAPTMAPTGVTMGAPDAAGVVDELVRPTPRTGLPTRALRARRQGIAFSAVFVACCVGGFALGELGLEWWTAQLVELPPVPVFQQQRQVGAIEVSQSVRRGRSKAERRTSRLRVDSDNYFQAEIRCGDEAKRVYDLPRTGTYLTLADLPDAQCLLTLTGTRANATHTFTPGPDIRCAMSTGILVCR